MTDRVGTMIAIVLAGGASSRMGTDKLALRRDGVSLRDTVVQATRDQLRALGWEPRLIVVGPERQPDPEGTGRPTGVTYRLEDPPGSGPVAALAAAVSDSATAASGTPDARVCVLAGDAPLGPDALPLLLTALDDASAEGRERLDGAVLVDANGRRQPLCAVYRVAALERALAAVGDPVGRGMYEVLDHLVLTDVADTVAAADDIDTPEDAARLGFTAP